MTSSEVRGALGQSGVLEGTCPLVVAIADLVLVVLSSGEAWVLGLALSLAASTLVGGSVVWSSLATSAAVEAVLETGIKQGVLLHEALVDFVSKVTVVLQFEHLRGKNAQKL